VNIGTRPQPRKPLFTVNLHHRRDARLVLGDDAQVSRRDLLVRALTGRKRLLRFSQQIAFLLGQIA